MKTTRKLFENQKTALLADGIVWGNGYFRPELGLATASDDRAYTVNNLHYAVSLLEAVADGRDVELREEEAISRANGIIERLLKPVALPRQSPVPGEPRKPLSIQRFNAPDAPKLSERALEEDVLSVLVFLDIHKSHLELSSPARRLVRHALEAILRDREAEAKRRDGGERRDEQTPGWSAPGQPDRDPVSVQDLLATVPSGYHWSDSIRRKSDIGIFDFPWPFPKWRCTCGIVDCAEVRCYVKARGATQATVPTRFYKGDWKPPGGRTHPVIFVGGWVPGVFQQQASGPGFTSEPAFSTLPPPVHVPEGHYLVPPPPLALPGMSKWHGDPWLEVAGIEIPYDADPFDGLATKLRQAGYDHVRFSQSHPGDFIQSSVDELYGVIDETKKLYQVDKVIVVCHSRGGLIARRCIADRWEAMGVVDVEKLITYGTAHLGAQLADIGEELITEMALTLATGPVAGPFLSSILDVIGLIPVVGAELKDQIESAIISLLAQALPPIFDGVRGFLESGEELKTTASFIHDLNQAYSAPVIPMEDRKISLWHAIDHVLIAGTVPTYFKIYIGSYFDLYNPLSITNPLANLTICYKTAKGPFGIKVRFPYPCYVWDWRWYPVLDVFSTFSAAIHAAASALTGLPTVVKAFQPGMGDSVVEVSSALAEGVDGRIRRATFELEHLNVKVNDDAYTLYTESPTYPRVVNPWQLLFLELGLPFDTASACPPDEDVYCYRAVGSSSQADRGLTNG